MSNRPDQPLGSADHEDGHWVLRYQRLLAHPVEKVWRALTESDHLRHWMPCDIVGERQVGAPMELPFWPAHVERYGDATPTMNGEIRVWDPPRVFEWTWDTDVLRWELEPVEIGTRLTFTTRLGDDSEGAANSAAGYHACLDHLIELLDTGSAPPLVDAEVGPWEERYATLVADAAS